jgi:RNA polymerase sigma-70 factor (ECF subfamily)
MRQLVRELSPAIRAGVSWVLTRGRGQGGREPRQEVEDVTQTVLLALFADQGRVLLQWDPARGHDLPGFAALLARRETVSILRSRRRNPWTEDPTLEEELDRSAVQRMSPESELVSKDLLGALASAVRARLPERGAELFDLIFLQGLPANEVSEKTGLSPDAVYQVKSRLQRQVREILTDLGRGPSSAPPPPPSSPAKARRRTVSGIQPAPSSRPRYLAAPPSARARTAQNGETTPPARRTASSSRPPRRGG